MLDFDYTQKYWKNAKSNPVFHMKEQRDRGNDRLMTDFFSSNLF